MSLSYGNRIGHARLLTIAEGKDSVSRSTRNRLAQIIFHLFDDVLPHTAQPFLGLLCKLNATHKTSWATLQRTSIL
jgi:hypothetical protein